MHVYRVTGSECWKYPLLQKLAVTVEHHLSELPFQ